MRKDKEKIFKLRREGKSYREIAMLVGISRSTLTLWFKGIPELEAIKRHNVAVNHSKEHLAVLHAGAKRMWEDRHSRAITEAREEFVLYHDDPLFVAGLMLYFGEGDKYMRYPVRIGNTDLRVLQIFILFLLKYCGVMKEQIKPSLLLYPDLNKEECLEWWAKGLNISGKQFYKTQVIQGRHKVRRLPRGVGTITISSTFLKGKIIEWIRLQTEELLTM